MRSSSSDPAAMLTSLRNASYHASQNPAEHSWYIAAQIRHRSCPVALTLCGGSRYVMDAVPHQALRVFKVSSRGKRLKLLHNEQNGEKPAASEVKSRECLLQFVVLDLSTTTSSMVDCGPSIDRNL